MSITREPTVLSAHKRALLALRLQQKGIRTRQLPPLVARTPGEPCPLSFAQRRLWFLDQMDPQSVVYLIPLTLALHGALDSRALECSLAALLGRHESLRTTFHLQGEEPVQRIHPPERRWLPLVDLTHLPAPRGAEQAHLLAAQEAAQPCDLARGPLLRMALLRVQQDAHIFLLTLHHIISDRWSNDLLLRELAQLYQAWRAGQPSPLAPLPIQYADYALWQRQVLQEETLAAQLAYWRTHLADLPVLDWPTDAPRPPRQSFRGATLSCALPGGLREALLALSRQQGVTLFMLLLAAFGVLLARLCGQEDLCVGTAISNRERPEVEGVIGFFVNTLPLRLRLAGNPRFAEVVRRAREEVLEAYAHQDVPFEHLVEALEPRRDLSRPPLFQITFRVQQALAEIEGPPELGMRPAGPEEGSAKFDMSVVVSESAHGLSCGVQYCTDLFQAASIQLLLEHWRVLLEEIVARPQAPVRSFSLLSARERRRLLLEWNATASALPVEQCLHTLFEAQAGRTPDQVALSSGDACLSYAALAALAGRLAAVLAARGGWGRALALAVSPSLVGVVALLATLKAGWILLPLDPTAPSERLAGQVEEAGAPLALVQRQHLPVFPLATLPRLCLEDQLQAAEPGAAPLCRQVLPEAPACLFSTSGSTGRPRGVMLTHRALVNRLLWGCQDLALTPADRVAQLASWSFDIALWEVLGPLAAGATCVLFAPGEVRESRLLLRRVREQEVTIMHMVPSLLNVLAREEELAACGSIRSIQCGGEVVTAELLRRVQAARPVPVAQYYGPTEAAINATRWCGHSPRDLAGISLGRPIANMRLYLVGQDWQPVAQGARGEIWLGGIGLALGYIQQPAHTAERFVPDAWGGEAGARLYRSGDVARYRTTGEIEFAGRRDRQVKIRGHRVEPAEIENALLAHPAVSACAVLARLSAQGEQQLLAYVVGEEGEERLRAYLAARVPAYMLPSYFISLAALPLTTSGKVDWRRLPEPEVAGQPLAEDAPATPMEEVLSTIWCEILGRPQPGRSENFFEVGGHSLLATRLISRIRSVLQVDLPLPELFDAPTIMDLGARLTRLLRAGGEDEAPALCAAARDQDLPLSFAQQRLWFLEQQNPGTAAYLIAGTRRLQGALQVAALAWSLGQLIARHESLRTTFAAQAGQPVQVIHARGTRALPLVDLCALPPEARETQARLLAAREAHRPCDLARGPLLRTTLLRLGLQEHVFLFTLHHSISDGWSDSIFLRELTTGYQARLAGQPLPLAPLPIQYADYALWQRRWLRGAVLEGHLAYWRQRLNGAQPLVLPGDGPCPRQAGARGADYHFLLPTELTQQAVQLSRQKGVTLFMLLLAVFQTLLYRWTGYSDILVGTDIANRTHVETEALIGFFVNLLALRTDLGGSPAFEQLLYRVRQVTLGAYAHQEIPFDVLIEHLRPQRYLNQNPLVQVLFVLQNFPQNTQPASGLAIRPLSSRTTSAKFDLALFLRQSAGGLHGMVVYKTDLLSEGAVSTLARRFETLLASACASPQDSIDHLGMLSEAERLAQARAREQRGQLQRSTLRTARGKEIDL
jgi:amino acid adenylation domain-containing protein